MHVLTIKVKHDSGAWEIIPNGAHGRGPIIRMMEDVNGEWLAEHWDSGSLVFQGTPKEALKQILKTVSGKDYPFNAELEEWINVLR